MTTGQLLIEGGSNSDHITGGQLGDTLNGGAGDDTLIGGAGNDNIDGGDGFDTAVYSGNRADYTITPDDTNGVLLVDGPDGKDTLRGVNRLQFADQTIEVVVPGVTLIGTDGDDNLSGGEGTDLLIGGAGNDILRGLFGNDRLEGGSGDDHLAGNGTLLGGDGNDVLEGGGDLQGGDGDDTLSGSGTLRGGAGNDLISGDGQLWGDDGNDVLEGGGDLQGGDGDDTLSGSGTLRGGAGNDLISGYGQLWGDDGDDLIQTGGQTVVDAGDGNDRVTYWAYFVSGPSVDGGTGYDVIDLSLPSPFIDYSDPDFGFTVRFPDFDMHKVVNFEEVKFTWYSSPYYSYFPSVVSIFDENVGAANVLKIGVGEEHQRLNVDASAVTTGQLLIEGGATLITSLVASSATPLTGELAMTR